MEKLNFNRRRQKPDSLEPLVSLESHSTKFVENKSFGGYDQSFKASLTRQNSLASNNSTNSRKNIFDKGWGAESVRKKNSSQSNKEWSQKKESAVSVKASFSKSGHEADQSDSGSTEEIAERTEKMVLVDCSDAVESENLQKANTSHEKYYEKNFDQSWFHRSQDTQSFKRSSKTSVEDNNNNSSFERPKMRLREKSVDIINNNEFLKSSGVIKSASASPKPDLQHRENQMNSCSIISKDDDLIQFPKFNSSAKSFIPSKTFDHSSLESPRLDQIRNQSWAKSVMVEARPVEPRSREPRSREPGSGESGFENPTSENPKFENPRSEIPKKQLKNKSSFEETANSENLKSPILTQRPLIPGGPIKMVQSVTFGHSMGHPITSAPVRPQKQVIFTNQHMIPIMIQSPATPGTAAHSFNPHLIQQRQMIHHSPYCPCPTCKPGLVNYNASKHVVSDWRLFLEDLNVFLAENFTPKTSKWTKFRLRTYIFERAV